VRCSGATYRCTDNGSVVRRSLPGVCFSDASIRMIEVTSATATIVLHRSPELLIDEIDRPVCLLKGDIGIVKKFGVFVGSGPKVRPG
jgi:hypothetical protein